MSEDIDRIIARYLEGSLSQEEQVLLDEWLKQHETHHKQLEYVNRVWKTPAGYPSIINLKDERDKVWARFQHENGNGLEKSLKTVPLYKLALRYAAALLLLASLTVIIYNFAGTTSEPEIPVTTIERNNPAGQKSRIHLPDGSEVWLNAGSKLSYTSDFNIAGRKLTLIGEAYFDVAKNPEIPFEVYTEELVITAIGTSFNVQAFDEHVEQVALNTGKVKVECRNKQVACAPSYLNPGDLAEYKKGRGNLELSRFEGEDPFGWKDGKIVFRHATFDEVFTVLERWYNVEFTFEGQLEREWNYTTTFEDPVLQNVLASLKFSEKINYEFKEPSKIQIVL